MADRLPPLNALKAFEAAARHLSLKRAAQELNVSPAAVSHQVKALEEYLGVQLFRRLNRGLQLTSPARAALPKLSAGFATLAQAVASLRPEPDGGRVTVNVAPSFAACWLMPRLHRFFAAHPEIDLRIAARMRHVSQAGHESPGERATIAAWLEESDVAILYGHGDYPGYCVDKLLALKLAPVCSPQLLHGEHPLRQPADLAHHTLLHDDSGTMYDGAAFWDIWLHAAGVSGVDTARGYHFSQPALALDAATDALGVAATFTVFAAGEFASGKLVMPFEESVPLASAYYLVCKEPAVLRPTVAAFRKWLLSESAAAPMADSGA